MTKATPTATTSAREIRRARLRRLGIRFTLWVIVPTLISAVYYGCLASPQYESVSSYSVEPDKSDSPLIRNAMRSRDMLKVLAADYGYVAHYSSPEADRWSRLDADADSEATYQHYLDVTDITQSKGTLTLSVLAYSAEAAQEFSRVIASESEKMINQLSERTRADRTKSAESEVERTRQSLIEVRKTIADLEPNPVHTSGTTPNEPGNLHTPMAPRDSDTIARYEQALLDKTLIQASYEDAFKSLARARQEAYSQRRYLVTISQPSLPTAPTHPRRWWGILSVFVLATTGMIVVSSIVAGIREHGQF